MTYIKILVGLVILIIVVFFFLGYQSQRGEAKGIMDGQLAKCPSSPNCASSETGTPDGKRVDPLSGTMEDAKAAITSLGGKVTLESDG